MSLFDLLAGTLDGVFAVDRDQRIAFWNEPAARILGFDAQSVLGRPCYEVLGAATDEAGCNVCEKGCAAFRDAERGTLSPTSEALVRTKDGESIWITVSTFVVPTAWHELSLLAHVFRASNSSRKLQLRPGQVLAEPPETVETEVVPRPLEPLTRREHEILQLLAAGASTASICSELDVGKATIRSHVQHVLAKLGVHSRLEAVASAARHGLLPASDD